MAPGDISRYRDFVANREVRYGKGSTCHAPRLRADEIDEFILQALCDFYASTDAVLADMINRAQAEHHAATGDGAAELTALASQITRTRDRHHEQRRHHRTQSRD